LLPLCFHSSAPCRMNHYFPSPPHGKEETESRFYQNPSPSDSRQRKLTSRKRRHLNPSIQLFLTHTLRSVLERRTDPHLSPLYKIKDTSSRLISNFSVSNANSRTLFSQNFPSHKASRPPKAFREPPPPPSTAPLLPNPSQPQFFFPTSTFFHSVQDTPHCLVSASEPDYPPCILSSYQTRRGAPACFSYFTSPSVRY